MRRNRPHLSLIGLVLAAIACGRAPTPDLEATVAVRVAATEAARVASAPTATPEATAVPTASATPQPTPTHTASPSPKPSATPTPSPTPSPTATPTLTPRPTDTPEPSATPTRLPPTQTPHPTEPPQDMRGLVVDSYWVEAAPGPFGSGQDIWFNFSITNSTNGTISYLALGTWVEETGQFQKSWTYSSLGPGAVLRHRDHINIAGAGTHRLWLAIHFSDGQAALLRGPITVTVE